MLLECLEKCWNDSSVDRTYAISFARFLLREVAIEVGIEEYVFSDIVANEEIHDDFFIKIGAVLCERGVKDVKDLEWTTDMFKTLAYSLGCDMTTFFRWDSGDEDLKNLKEFSGQRSGF
jgi:hypothetical protein